MGDFGDVVILNVIFCVVSIVLFLFMIFLLRSVINRAVSWLRSFDCDEID